MCDSQPYTDYCLVFPRHIYKSRTRLSWVQSAEICLRKIRVVCWHRFGLSGRQDCDITDVARFGEAFTSTSNTCDLG